MKVLGGAAAIVVGACVLAYATARTSRAQRRETPPSSGILAALGAGLLWGTMYIPYRKAYISGMNPLSFVTVFTFGELGTVFALALVFDGGIRRRGCVTRQGPAGAVLALPGRFLLGVGRPVPAVRGEVHRHRTRHSAVQHQPALGAGLGRAGVRRIGRHKVRLPRLLVVAGSLVMIAGAVAISLAEAPESEQHSWRAAMERECRRYGLDRERVSLTVTGGDPLAVEHTGRRWWEFVIVAGALAVFAWLALAAERPPIPLHAGWMALLVVASISLLIACGLLLWKRTRFS